jgi:hypothetical protein
MAVWGGFPVAWQSIVHVHNAKASPSLQRVGRRLHAPEVSR